MHRQRARITKLNSEVAVHADIRASSGEVTCRRATSLAEAGFDRHRNLLNLLATQIELRMLLAIMVVIAVLSTISPYFLTVNNMLNLLSQSVVVGLLALGQTLVILIGGIDLSVGSLVGVTGIILGLSPLLHHLSMPAAFAVLINGVIITYGRVAAFVVTLGMMSIGRSMAYVLSGANSISGLPAGLGALAGDSLFDIPVDFWFLVVCYAMCWRFLNYTKGGRTLYALDSNAEVARVADLRIQGWMSAFWSSL